MLAFLVSFLVDSFYSDTLRGTAARCDLGRYVARNGDGRRQSYRERLNVRAFAATCRTTFESVDIAQRRERREMAIRCDVYAERNGFAGVRAVFNVA
jgi:hypothetical protein